MGGSKIDEWVVWILIAWLAAYLLDGIKLMHILPQNTIKMSFSLSMELCRHYLDKNVYCSSIYEPCEREICKAFFYGLSSHERTMVVGEEILASPMRQKIEEAIYNIYKIA